MQWIIDLTPALIVLGVLIFIHELGHFIACRLLGVRVEKFSIGFGPEIFHIEGRQTRYAVSVIPLGGFVKPSGESYEDIERDGPRPYDFLAKGPVVRLAIAFAGVMMNFVLAYFLFVAVFTVGRPVLAAKIGGFVEGYPATTSGLKAGDRVVSVQGVPVESWRELTDRIYEAGSSEIRLAVERNGRFDEVRVAPRLEEVADPFGKIHKRARIGILPAEEYIREQYPLPASLVEAGKTLIGFTGLTVKSIGYLVTGRLSLKAVSGPIGIFSLTSKTAKLGWVHLIQLTAFLSASLAVFNLIPFPPLDGGLIFFTLLEMVRRRQVSVRVQEAVTRAGLVLLIMLMVVVMYNDLVHIDFFQRLKSVLSR